VQLASGEAMVNPNAQVVPVRATRWPARRCLARRIAFYGVVQKRLRTGGRVVDLTIQWSCAASLRFRAGLRWRTRQN